MNRIKEIRKEKRLSQERLGDIVGTTKQHIGRLESGKSSLSDVWLERLSKALGCTKAELLGETPTLSREDQVMLEYFRRLPPKRKERYLRNLREEIEDLEETEAPEKAKEKAG